MSIFTEGGQTTDTDQAQAQDQNNNQGSFLDKLVEAKGENWRDPEVLAKGKLESDTYIKELERQIAELKQDVTKEDYAKKLLQEIRDKAAAPSTANSTPPTTNSAGTNSEELPQSNVSEEDLKSLVEKTLVEREKQATVQQNLATVEAELKEKFGTEAQATVVKKAQELGISVKRMEEIASESPSAFFALIGEQRKATNPVVSGSVRTDGVNFTQSSERNWAYYQKLRRENKNLYYTPKVQQQLMADKNRLGDKFGL